MDGSIIKLKISRNRPVVIKPFAINNIHKKVGEYHETSTKAKRPLMLDGYICLDRYYPQNIPFSQKGIHWIVNRIKWHGISEDAREITFAFNSYSWTYLQQAPPSINYGVIERPEIDQIRRYWQSWCLPNTRRCSDT